MGVGRSGLAGGKGLGWDLEGNGLGYMLRPLMPPLMTCDNFHVFFYCHVVAVVFSDLHGEMGAEVESLMDVYR